MTGRCSNQLNYDPSSEERRQCSTRLLVAPGEFVQVFGGPLAPSPAWRPAHPHRGGEIDTRPAIEGGESLSAHPGGWAPRHAVGGGNREARVLAKKETGSQAAGCFGDWSGVDGARTRNFRRDRAVL